MEKHIFISDLHLSPERPATVELFLDFLRTRARAATSVYILGDLFDAWIGDDDDRPPHTEVRMALRALTASGTRCAIMHGNRDFLIGRRFARDTGCSLLEDPTLLDLCGTPTLLMHGDLLCTDDLPYQKFRRHVRNPLVIRLILWKSLEKRRAMAAEYRQKSGAATALKHGDSMDVNQKTVEAYMRRFQAVRMIHGHTHRPADHAFQLDGREVLRSVLAEWHEDSGEALVVSTGHWRREPIRAGGSA